MIDYSKPSTEKRLWVFDLRSHALLHEELVAHGKGSGERFATAFSNNPESHQSSLGLFETTDTYSGKNGYSLRLKGLDAGFNDKALERAIVMHGAPYVSEKVAKSLGRLGRSWGCPAVREAVAHEIIDRIRGNGLLFRISRSEVAGVFEIPRQLFGADSLIALEKSANCQDCASELHELFAPDVACRLAARTDGSSRFQIGLSSVSCRWQGRDGHRLRQSIENQF